MPLVITKDKNVQRKIPLHKKSYILSFKIPTLCRKPLILRLNNLINVDPPVNERSSLTKHYGRILSERCRNSQWFASPI